MLLLYYSILWFGDSFGGNQCKCLFSKNTSFQNHAEGRITFFGFIHCHCNCYRPGSSGTTDSWTLQGKSAPLFAPFSAGKRRINVYIKIVVPLLTFVFSSNSQGTEGIKV